MSVAIRLPFVFRSLAAGHATVRVEAATVELALRALAQEHEPLGPLLFAPEGGLRRGLNVYVNGEDIRYLGGMRSGVGEGDEIVLLPSATGG